MLAFDLHTQTAKHAHLYTDVYKHIDTPPASMCNIYTYQNKSQEEMGILVFGDFQKHMKCSHFILWAFGWKVLTSHMEQLAVFCCLFHKWHINFPNNSALRRTLLSWQLYKPNYYDNLKNVTFENVLCCNNAVSWLGTDGPGSHQGITTCP